MKLKTKIIGLEAGGKAIVVLNRDDAEDLGIRSLGRIRVGFCKKEITAMVNITTKIVAKGHIGICEEVKNSLNLKDNNTVEIKVAKFPASLGYIRNKLAGRKLSYYEIKEIVKDVVERNLNEIEIASFVTALHSFGLDLDEAASLSSAMVETGERLRLNRTCADKHCLSGDIPTIVKNDGNVKVENIGNIIDKIFERCDPSDIAHERDCEFIEKNLNNLQVLVHDDDGYVNFVPVTGIFRVKSPRYLKEMTLIGNRKIKTTFDHTIFTFKNGKIVNKMVCDIKPNDYVIVPTGFKNDKIIEKICVKDKLKEEERRKDCPKEIKISPEFMRLLGYYAAEGFTNYQGIFLNFGSHESELIKDSIKCIKKVFKKDPTINKPTKTSVRVCVYSQTISKIFEKIIKAGSRALKKEIPSFIFEVSDEMKFEFLRALFKGDGYIRRGYEAVYVTSSKKLSSQIQYLLSFLGLSTAISIKRAGKRKFPITKDTTYESKTSESYYIYTQAREIFGGRKKANVAFINLFPIKELGHVEIEHMGWEFRKELKKNKYITKQKLAKIFEYIKSEDTKKLIDRNLSVLRVKKIKTVFSNSKFVYDFKVDRYHRFVAGSAPICIHNSIGGVPGDKTTLLLVPIVAACGLVIPKTSSRAITSAAGTADRAEVLMPVDLGIEEMREVVDKTGGCIVWGGALHLAPADDIFIQVEHPLSIDPLLLPSIMSKKKAVNAEYLVIDIPCGRGTKVKTIGDADLLAKDFIELGKKLGIRTQCAITYGEQPIGYTIGPGLEAMEALEVLGGKKSVPDLVDKATDIAGILLGMVGKKNGKRMAVEALKSGKAEAKMREIISAQGGDGNIKPEEIEIGRHRMDICSESTGYVLWINNTGLAEVARAAGSPKDTGAGVRLYKKLGDHIKKGGPLFTIYSEKVRKLKRAEKIMEAERLMGIGKRMEMLIHEVKELPVHKKAFILER